MWGWDGTTPEGVTVVGTVREGEDRRERARAEAELWLGAHPDGTVRLGIVRLTISVADLAACWDSVAPERSRWADGKILWERVPPAGPAVGR